VIGLILVALGLLFLADRALALDLGRLGWPLFIIGPGLLLLVAGLLTGGGTGMGMTVPGSVVTTVGLILLYQDRTDHYESWAYAWALIPVGIGIGTGLWGLLHGRSNEVRDAVGAIGFGVVAFVIGFVFFEGVLNLGGLDLGPIREYGLPLLLIGLGLLMVIGNLARPRLERRWTGRDDDPGAGAGSIAWPPPDADSPPASAASTVASTREPPRDLG
jgi:hypothetical protein